MNRSPQAEALLTRSIAALVALLGLTLPARGDDQQAAADRVNSLRAGLRQDQRDYVKALGGQSVEAKASDYVSLLRDELKAHVKEIVQASGGGEAELALRRAAVRHRLDVIHAYEDAIGDRRLPRTTEWNVFSSEELSAIRLDARSNLGELVHSAVDLPDAEVPLRLRGRIRELGWQLDALEQERSSRIRGGEPRLRTIDARVTVAEARSKFAAIDSVDGLGAGAHAERVLHVEVAMRRVASPDDASLARLGERAAWAPGTDIETGPGKRGPPWLNDRPPPPPRGPDPGGGTPPDGPPRPPGLGPRGTPDVRGPPRPPAQELGDALAEELDAIRSRDPVSRAWARSRVATGKKLLNAALQTDATPAHAVLDAAQLDQLRDGYAEWEKNLVRESVTKDSTELKIEIGEARASLREIDAEFARRANPSALRGRAQISRAMDLTGQSAEYGALRASERVVGWSEYRLALRLELDLPRTVPDPRVKVAYDEAVASSLRAEVEHLNSLWDEASGLERAVLRDGRGPEGARIGSSLVRAKHEIRAAGRELAERIQRTLARGAPAEMPSLNREILRATGIEAAADAPADRAAVMLAEARAGVTRLVEPRGAGYLQVRGRNGLAEVGVIRNPTSPGRAPIPREPLAPTEYESLFPREEAWTRDFKGLTEETIESLRRAPGGVIVDATLPVALLRQIDEIRVDLDSGSVQIRSGGAWQAVAPGSMPRP